MHGEAVLYLKKDGVAWVTLNKPQAQNRVNLRMCTELRGVCEAIAQDDAVRLAVITGAGESFCAGDEEEPPGLSNDASVEQIRAYLDLRRAASFLGGVEKPLIAAINGDALGHGLELALACDIRVAASDAKLGMTQIRQGTIPWDGGTQRLPRIVGRAWATDMLLNGRIVDAEEALRIGLVHQMLPPEDMPGRLEQMASTMAALAPIATRYAKEVVLKGMDMTLEQGLRLETDLNVILQTTRDRAEGSRLLPGAQGTNLHGGVNPESNQLYRRNFNGNVQHELLSTLRSGGSGRFALLLQLRPSIGHRLGVVRAGAVPDFSDPNCATEHSVTGPLYRLLALQDVEALPRPHGRKGVSHLARPDYFCPDIRLLQGPLSPAHLW